MAAQAVERNTGQTNHHRFLQRQGARRAQVTGEALAVAMGNVARAVSQRLERMQGTPAAKSRRQAELSKRYVNDWMSG